MSNKPNIIYPRPYQLEALEKIKESKEHGGNSSIVSIASGLGKTYLAGFESLNYSGKVLFICHRSEILIKSEKIFSKIYYCNNISRKTGFYIANNKQHKSDVLFASIQTLILNYNKFKRDEFDLIIIDEFHHSLADSYKKIIHYFTPKFKLGLTATPYRLDDVEGKRLKKLFNSEIVYNMDLPKGIDLGYLSPFTLIFHKDNIDYSKIRYRNHKYNESDLNKALLIDERDISIINEYNKKLKNRKCLGFCISIRHVNRMVKLFNKHGICAKGITTRTTPNDRINIQKEFESGKIKIIFSVNIYNEGIDIPEIDGILLLRPTTSKVIFYQQIGRGLRMHEKKKDVIILDFIGNYKNSRMHHIWLSKKKVRPSEVKMNKKNEYIYPNGCKVEFSKEVIDLFEEMESRIVNKKNLINDYFRLKKILGRKPVSSDFCYRNKIARFSEQSYRRMFGTWNNFLKYIGEPTYDECTLINPSKNEIIHAYNKLRKNGAVHIMDLVKELDTSISSFYIRVPNWNDFIREMGDYPNVNIKKEDVIKSFFEVKKNINKVPTKKEFDKHGFYSRSVTQRLFGSYKNLVKESMIYQYSAGLTG